MVEQMDGDANNSFPFPVGGGECGRLIRDFDWSKTDLGPISDWPQWIRTSVDICLQAPIPIVMLFGPDGFLIYNDAYAAFAGQRHPQLLGMKVLEGWPEAADLNRQVLDTCYINGGTLSLKEQPLVLFRYNNAADQLWLDLDYSPILNDEGKPGGVFAIVVETTEKVNIQRTLAAERIAVMEANKRLSAESTFLRDLFEQAPSFMAIMSGPAHVFVLANTSYQQLIGGRNVVGMTIRDALPEIVDQGFVELLDRVFTSGQPHIGSGSRITLDQTVGGGSGERYLDFIYQPIRNSDGKVSGIFVEGQDVTERMRGEQHLRLVVNELNHRVKNTLAMIQAVAAQTFRNAGDLPQAQAVFSARIMALARANDLLTGENWEGASLSDIVAGVSVVHAGNQPDRFTAKGPVVRLSPKAALSLSMAMHELATNAVKYGALSNDAGRVDVSWSVKDGRMRIEWRESGGPSVAPPERRGFGSRLVERGLAGEMGGTAQIAFEPTGVVCVIEAPMDIYEGSE
ncbi:MAG: HWE histidine kinase domain-containing protein [Hyphomonadaceae bacterium]|nr:HWE histidine kinase domain-containing protein [Hyphomonadaceae bacterium]